MCTVWREFCATLYFSLSLSLISAFHSSTPPVDTLKEHGAIRELHTDFPLTRQQPIKAGVKIEEVSKGSALERAGLLAGDVIMSWERLSNPPSNPAAVKGILDSYFSWLELESEQAPRGVVVLRGQRHGVPMEFKVQPGFWSAKVMPVLPPSHEKVYLAGKANLALGNHASTIRTWRAVGEDSKPDQSIRIWADLIAAEVWEKNGEWGRAIEIYREVLREALAPQVRSTVLGSVGSAYEAQNDFDSAESAFALQLEVLQENFGESLVLSRSLMNLARIYDRKGLSERASSFILHALKIQERIAPGCLSVADNLSSLGLLAWDRGDFSSARTYELKALHIRSQLAPVSLQMAGTLNRLGNLDQAEGNFDQAQSYLLRALALSEEVSPQGLEVASSLNSLGAVAYERGDMDAASDYFLRSIKITEKHAPRSLDLAASIGNLGIVAIARGDSVRAYDYLHQSLEMEKKLAPQGLAVATSLNNLGYLVAESQEFERAEEYFRQSLRIRERLAPNSLAVANSLYNLGTIAEDRGQLGRAEQFFRQAIEIQERIAPNSIHLAQSIGRMGENAKSKKDLIGALKFYRKALTIAKQVTPFGPEVAIFSNRLGNIMGESGETSQAYDYYISAVEALEHQLATLGGSYQGQSRFRYDRYQFYEDALSALLQLERFSEALHLLERFRAQTFLAMLAERDLVFSADIPADLDKERRRLGVQYDRTLRKLAELNSREHADLIEVTRHELQRLDGQAGELEARIRKVSPRLAALAYPQPLEVEEIRNTLDPGTLLIVFSVGEEETAIFTVSWQEELDVKIVALGYKAIQSRVKRLLYLIGERRGGTSMLTLRERQLKAASQELYSALLIPVIGRVATSKRLLILPDGPLNRLPFAALMREGEAESKPGSGQYLVEWKPLHVAPSATVFAELKQRRGHTRESIPAQLRFEIAAFGDPVYPSSLLTARSDSMTSGSTPMAFFRYDPLGKAHYDPVVRLAAKRGFFNWQPLPYTRQEVEGIIKLFPSGAARIFLGADALEDKIKSLDRRTRILHVAAHGYVDRQLPSNSFVALTIPDKAKSDAEGTERDNGLLQVWEIFEQVRVDADLVVLSACDTGLGEAQGGEGLIGFTRAFQYAGARTVMASLWSVQDQATSELMIRFYKHLRAGLTKDEALRHAQIELIRSPIEVVNEKGEKTLLDASAPYYWAGFQLYGDWQ